MGENQPNFFYPFDLIKMTINKPFILMESYFKAILMRLLMNCYL